VGTVAPARKGRPQATDSADTRRRILAAARECFGRQGFDRTTNKDIAAAAGITQAAIYHYFPSKQDVFAAVFREMQRATFARFEQVLASEDTLAGRVKALLGLAAEMHVADQTLARFTAIAPLEIQRHPDLRGALGHDALAVYDFFDRLVELSADDLRPDVDPASVVNLLVAVSTGFSQFGATSRVDDAHRAAIDSFGRLIDGTLIRPGAREADSGRNGRRRHKAMTRPATLDDPDTRRRILAAARHCFGASGYDVTTNKDIGAAAGVTAGAIYRYFPSKHDLFVEVFLEIQGTVFAEFEQVVSDQVGMAARLRAVLDLCVEMHGSDRSLAAFTAVAPIEIQRHPEIRSALGQEALVVYRFFRRMVWESSDDLAPDVDPDSVVNLLVAVVTGFSAFGATTRSPKPHREAIATFERLAEGTLFEPTHSRA
jgi:AcrR family transcriptional regulator